MRCIYIILFIIIFTSKSFAQYCNSFFCGQFEPIVQQHQDSVYYLFTLSGLYELHTTKGYRNVYKTQWYGPCTFDLLYTGSSKEASEYAVNQRFKCTITPAAKSAINYTVNGKIIPLKKYDSQNLWTVMATRDVQLVEENKKSEQLLDEYKSKLTQADSAAGIRMVEQLQKMLYQASDITTYQLNAISTFFNDLRTYDAEHFYANSSPKFKTQISAEDLKRYFYYLQKVYGQWVYFTVHNQSLNSHLFDSSNVEMGISKYSFLVKFEHTQREVQVDLALDNTKDLHPIEGQMNSYLIKEQPKTIQYLSIGQNDYDSSPFLEQISTHFFENFYTDQYEAIYNASSDVLKSLATAQQFADMLQKARSMSDKKYTFYQHAFSIDTEKGGLISLHYITETQTGGLLMTTTYSLDTTKKIQLVGINFKPI